MKLDEAQRKIVSGWIADGLKLSEIQNRLNSDLSVRLTYMEVRLLVDDLKLVPKDPEPIKTVSPPAPPLGVPPVGVSTQPAPETGSAAATGNVAVSVDQITKPGSVVSGKVTFGDGNQADWHLDQTGRLGLSSKQPGYRPAAADVQQFQLALEKELTKMGL